MNLFTVTITDKLASGKRKPIVLNYAVLASSADDAEAKLRAERPQAFYCVDRVTVEQHDGGIVRCF